MNRLTRNRGSATARRVGVVATGVALVAMAVTAPTPAQAAPDPRPLPGTLSSSPPADAVPGGFVSWQQLFRAQDRLNRAAGTILAAAGDGYAGIVAAPESRQLRVYWKGSVSPAARSAATKSGVPVAFLPAAFSQRELVAEAKRVAADPRVASAAAKVDGSGLAVTVLTGLRSAATDVPATSRVPVTVTGTERPQPMLGRQADTPPFSGGSRYDNPALGGSCTNGWAADVPGTANVFMISAGHCGSFGQFVTIPGQSSLNDIVSDVDERDTLGVHYPDGVHGAIYRGPFNFAATAPVGGVAADFVGNFVCTGGSFSGEHCGVQVQAVDLFVNIGHVIGPETQASAIAGQCAVAPGDSGGPVYAFQPAGKVEARGTISAGVLGTARCPGLSPNGSNVVWYAPLLRPAGDPQVGSLQFYGVGVLTS
ncbi:MAG: hypothetical protein QOE03_2819 [Micromonosporaceae bacterium]|nr:hypothetical protein [Micromonosporaceae bacterium]